MIHSVKFTCVLDTNVIYPIEIRDLLFWFAHFELYTQSVDDFLTDLIDLNHQRAIEAFRRLVMNRRNPDLDEYQVLDAFRRNGLKDTADYLHALL